MKSTIQPIHKDKDGSWFIELWFIPIMVGFVPGLIMLAILLLKT